MGTLSEYGKQLFNAYHEAMNKRKKNVLIFGAWFGQKYDDNPKYLFEYVVSHCPELEPIWMTENLEVYNYLTKRNLPVCLSESEEAKTKAHEAGYVFTATGKRDVGRNNEMLLAGAYFINLWHGVPLKKIMYDNDYLDRKLICKEKLKKKIEWFPYYRREYVVSTSRTITDIYRSAFLTKSKKILQLGQPRNDYFYCEHSNEYKEKYANKRFILYMPTHRNEGKTRIDVKKLFDLTRLNAYCQQTNTVFIIKKHFYHSGENDDLKEYDSIFDITNETTETQHLLDAADVLITDYSSCYIDYLLLNRPIVFFCYDIDQYRENDRQMYFEYNTVTPGNHCRNFEELEKTLWRLFEEKDQFSDKRKKVCDLFYDINNQCLVSKKIIENTQQLWHKKLSIPSVCKR